MYSAQIITARFEVYDSRFYDLVPLNAQLVRLFSGGKHSEGPVYVPDKDSLIWSDVIGDRLLQWQAGNVSVYRAAASYQNGNALDLEGRIVACSHGYRAIVRQDHDGKWRILVDHYQGNRLNSPNDIIVKSDGTIWFTDPPFGLTQANQGCGGEQEQPGSYVYRFDPATGEISAVVTDMCRPNGLVFSPNEQQLYVSDTSAFENPTLYHDIQIFDVVNGRSLANGRKFADINPGQPDGLCVDRSGHLFSSSEDSVQIFTPDAVRLGKIFTPEVCANLTFGGKQRNCLFIAAGGSVYAIDLKTQGTNLHNR